MPFLFCRHRQRGIDKPDDFLREIRRPAIAHPLRIAPADHKTCSFESPHVTRHAGLAGTEFAHQLANTMLALIAHYSEGFGWIGSVRPSP